MHIARTLDKETNGKYGILFNMIFYVYSVIEWLN